MEKIPTKEETKLMFIEESRKLAEGLIKRQDEQQRQITNQDKEIDRLNTKMKQIFIFGGVLWAGLTTIATKLLERIL